MAVAGNQGADLNLLARYGHTVGPFVGTWRDSTGTPVDISGADFRSAIRQQGQTVKLDEFDIVPTGNPGEFSFVLPFGRCALLPQGQNLAYTLSAIIGDTKIPLLAGTLTLKTF